MHEIKGTTANGGFNAAEDIATNERNKVVY